MGRIKSLMQEFHPIVWSLVIGTVFVRAASSMSMPFLFLYLSNNTDMDLGTIGLMIGAGALAGTVVVLLPALCPTGSAGGASCWARCMSGRLSSSVLP